jgi:hypothetical protein
VVFTPADKFQVCAEAALAKRRKNRVTFFMFLLVKDRCKGVWPSLTSKIRINNAISIYKIKRI